MSALSFLIISAVNIYLFILLLRVWMQAVGADFYNPGAQFIVKVTQPIVAPFRRLLPFVKNIDIASLVVAYLVALIKVVVLFKAHSSLIMLWFAFLTLLKSFGFLIFWLLIIRAIMSWFSRGQSALDQQLYQLTEPLMAPIRRVIPTFAGLDFSAMIVVFLLYFLNRLAFDLFGIIWVYL